MPSVVLLFGLSLFASALGGALGMASGIFIVPILAGIVGLDIHTAVAAGIVSVIACSCASAGPFLKSGLTNVKLAIVLEVATTAGAASGVFLSNILPARFLYATFALVLAVSAWQMLFRRRGAQNAPALPAGWSCRLASQYPDPLYGTPISYAVYRLPLGLGLMYCAGLLSALLGIGSGVLKVPAMDTVLRLPMKVSSATSNFMIGVTATASAGAYLVQGAIKPAIAGPVALGSVVGAILGAYLLMAVPVRWLRNLFVVVLLALCAQMALTALNVHW